jgi:hypothetical protein
MEGRVPLLGCLKCPVFPEGWAFRAPFLHGDADGFQSAPPGFCQHFAMNAKSEVSERDYFHAE